MSSGDVAFLFAHDAAAGNATFAFGLELERRGYRVVAHAEGPSIEIYHREIPHLVADGPPAFEDCDLVVTGLSTVHSRFELDMVRLARAAGVKRTISIMDVHFHVDSRFQTQNEFVSESSLPDEIWVPENILPSSWDALNRRFVVRPNPYWEHVRRTKYTNPPIITDHLVDVHRGRYLLLATEYIQDQYGDSLGFTEKTLMQSFLRAMVDSGCSCPVLVKTHPAEEPGKYHGFVEHTGLTNVHIASGTLEELLFHSRMLVGFLNTAVFHEAACMGKASFSLQLGGDGSCDYTPSGVTVLREAQELVSLLRQCCADSAIELQ